jgi:F-type H+-transporting ATPase subunit a
MAGEHAESFHWFKHAFPVAYENAANLFAYFGRPVEVEVTGANGEVVTHTGYTTYLQGYPLLEPGADGHLSQAALTEAHGPLALLHVGLVTLILVVIGLLAYSKVKDTKAALIPDDKLSVRTIVEVLVGAAYGMMKDIMGPKAARFFLPLIGTCAFFILFSNALGMIPGFLPPTSSLSVTLACALVIFFTTHIFGVKEHGISYFKHFLGPIIKWYALPLMLLFVVVEVISHVVRPISLGVRLMANMFADHAVLAIFLGLVPFVLPVPVLLLGSLVVVVQTLVFCILSTVYISMAIEHAEDHH